MAFPEVKGTSTDQKNNVTSHDVFLPVGVVPGELLLAFFGDSFNSLVTFPVGWTKITDFTATSGQTIKLSVYSRIADGSEGTKITITTGSSESSVFTAYRISGHDPSRVPAGAIIGQFDEDPNSPNLIPPGGIRDYLWFTSYIKRVNDILITKPGGYVSPVQHVNSSIPLTQGTAQRALNAASEDPGVWNAIGDTLWIASTIAVGPPVTISGSVPALAPGFFL